MSKNSSAFSSDFSESDELIVPLKPSVVSVVVKNNDSSPEKSSEVCAMTESEIRSRLDAFAKELAQAKQNRAPH